MHCVRQGSSVARSHRLLKALLNEGRDGVENEELANLIQKPLVFLQGFSLQKEKDGDHLKMREAAGEDSPQFRHVSHGADARQG